MNVIPGQLARDPKLQAIVNNAFYNYTSVSVSKVES